MMLVILVLIAVALVILVNLYISKAKASIAPNVSTKKNTNMTEQAQKAFGKRVLAGLIDLILWFVLFIVAAVNFGEVTTVTQHSGTSSQATLTGSSLLIFMLVELGYFVILEWCFGGTIGKLLTGVRVIGADGRRITPKQALIRNVMRAADAFPYIVPYLTGLIIIAGDERKRRLGDKTADTLVVLRRNLQ